MSKRMSMWTLLAFASPGIPATLLISPVFGFLPSYYAIHTHVTLAEVGTAFLLARVIDALIDPFVGVLSDRTRSRLGPRLPWMIAGGVLGLPSAYFFFLPPSDAGAVYFFVTSFLTMVGWTLFTIPHGAWAAEISDDYDERSRIFGVKQVLATVGGFALFFLPPLLAPLTGTTEFNETTMKALIVALIVLTPATLIWAATKVPLKGAAIEQVGLPPASLMSVLRSIWGNRPFVIFVVITILVGVAQGMVTGLSFLYVQDYLGIGKYFFAIGIVPGVAGIAVTPFWLWAARHFDKQKAWAWGLWLSAIAGAPILLLTPGIHAFIPLLVVMTLAAIMQSSGIALPSSILADVADYETWKQNTKATGNYFALLVFLSKVTTAAGSSLALLMSGVMGYVSHAQGGKDHVAALVVPFIVIPLVLTFLAGFLVYCFPLDRRRHALIMNRLAKREEQLARSRAAA